MFGLSEKTEIRKIESYVGVDIGTYAIKVVQVRRDNDQVHLETYGELEMAAYDALPPGSLTVLGEQKILQALRDLFTAAKVTSTNVVFGIPISSCFISTISIPHVSDNELKSIVPIEARKYLPVPVSEVKLNYWRIATTKSSSAQSYADTQEAKEQVIIAAVKNETMEMYERLAKSLGLSNVSFEIESLAGARIAASGAGESEAILYVDIGGRVTSMSFVHAGTVKATNIIRNGSFENTAQIAKVLGLSIDVAEEAKRLFGYEGDESSPHLSEVMELSSYPLFDELLHLGLKYERMYNVNIKRIILSGGGSLVKSTKEQAEKVFKKEVSLADPFKDLILPDNFKKVAAAIDQEYTVAVGLALKNIL